MCPDRGSGISLLLPRFVVCANENGRDALRDGLGIYIAVEMNAKHQAVFRDEIEADWRLHDLIAKAPEKFFIPWSEAWLLEIAFDVLLALLSRGRYRSRKGGKLYMRPLLSLP